MLEKQAHDALLKQIDYGRVELTYWDGTVRSYGQSGPSIPVEVKDPAFVWQIARNASLAVGRAYTNGTLIIAEDDLPVFFEIIFNNRPQHSLRQLALRAKNRQGRQRKQIAHHYDIGNDYYELWLDPTRTYSCAYFQKEGESLEQAQRGKIDYVLRKLRVQPGQRLLDIGCGWGHLAVTAAKKYGVNALGITLSKEQLAGARELAKREGVTDRVEFQLIGYQELRGEFDRICSVGMFEHVGRKNQADYFGQIRRLLADDGVSVLHTITTQQERRLDPWVDKYIFPGGHLPTVAGIMTGLAEQNLWPIASENLWQHYAETLRRWRAEHRRHRDTIISMFDEPFYRMRDFWLAGSEAGFQHGDLGLWQFEFTKQKPKEWELTRAGLYD